MKKLLPLLIATLGFATAAAAQAVPPPFHLDVKIVVNAGPTVDHPVYRSNFDSLTERVNLTPTQGPTMKRVAFGIKGEVKNAAGEPVSATIRFTEAPAWLVWKDGVLYRSGTVPIFNKPLDSYGSGSTDTARFTRPDLYGTTTSGALTTGDFTSSTVAFTGSAFYLADHKWALGTDVGANGVEVPSPHTPMTSTVGSGYTAGYTLRGHVDIPGTETGDFDFVVLPGRHIASAPTIGDTLTTTFIFRRLATVEVTPTMSLDQWVAQLQPGATTRNSGDGSQTQAFVDPSGLGSDPHGYRLLGFEGSTDLVNWTFIEGNVTIGEGGMITVRGPMFTNPHPNRFYYRAIGGYVNPSEED